jgi:four helix bundle protein
VIKLVRKIHVEYYLSKQILRSATSAGANYEEACNGESRADFVHKLQITLKELSETVYWLKLFEKVYLTNSNQELARLIQENKELCAIIARSVLTAKKLS